MNVSSLAPITFSDDLVEDSGELRAVDEIASMDAQEFDTSGESAHEESHGSVIRLAEFLAKQKRKTAVAQRTRLQIGINHYESVALFEESQIMMGQTISKKV